MNIIETQFKQRAYDGKWEKIVQIWDNENKYVYKSDSGSNITYTPTKWVTVGVFDYMAELV